MWLPDASGTRLTLHDESPHAYVPSHVGIPKPAALELFRRACSTQPLCLRGNDSMPVRAFNSKAPDWSPSLSRFPDEDARMARFIQVCGGASHTIGGCLAVPVYASPLLDGDGDGARADGTTLTSISSSSGNSVVAVLEVTFARWELCSVADALRAVAVAMQTVQLHVPLAPVLTLSPLTVPRQQTPALVRLTSVMDALAADHHLPLAQIWVPATAEGHNQPASTGRGESQTLHTRGLPHVVNHPSAWGYRASCASSALRCGTLGTGAAASATQGDSPHCDAGVGQMPQGTPGAAFSANGAVWVAHAMALRHACNPLRGVASLCGVPFGSVTVMVVVAINAQDVAPLPFMLEMLLPPGAPHEQLTAMAALLPALAAACNAVQLTALLPARMPLAKTLQALAAAAEAASCAGGTPAPVAWLTGSRSASARVPDAFFCPPMSRSSAAGVLTGVYEAVMQPTWTMPSQTAPAAAPAAGPQLQHIVMPEPPLPALPTGTCAVSAAPSAGGPISLAQIQAQFSNPLRTAATALKVCPTTLKAMCRRHGIQKWPYRTLAKLQNSADQLRGAIENVGGATGAMEAAVNLRAMSLPATSPALKLSTKGAAAAAARRGPRKPAAKRQMWEEDTGSDADMTSEGEGGGGDDSAHSDELKRRALPPRKRGAAAPSVARVDGGGGGAEEVDGAQQPAVEAPRRRHRKARCREQDQKDGDGCVLATVPIPAAVVVAAPVVAAPVLAPAIAAPAVTPMSWSDATPWKGALPLHPADVAMAASPTLSAMGPAWTPQAGTGGLRAAAPLTGLGGVTNVSALGGTPRLLWGE